MAVVFLVMLVSAGTRATPGVLLVPWEQSLGWSRTSISFALFINLALYGLMGPFAAAAMERYGVRTTALSALLVMAVAVAASGWMHTHWQMWVLWGLLVGCTTGATAMTLGATIVNRWFVEKRGFATGVLIASTATGQLIFLPMLARLVQNHGWQAAAWVMTCGIVLVWPLAWWLLPERPANVGLQQYGAAAENEIKAEIKTEAQANADTKEPSENAATKNGSINPTKPVNPLQRAFSALKMAVHVPAFWLLFFSFFVCGATTNGYIGTHFIAMCGDYGLSGFEGASILAAMGVLDLVGTTLSGWLSDRYDNRKLLFVYYALRGVALIYLPYAFGLGYFGLPLFAFLYGLDWIATVPPTVRLTSDVFGRDDGPIVFGWIATGHQLGAATAALVGGMLRNTLGTYTVATMLAGAACVVASVLVLRINRTSHHTNHRPPNFANQAAT